MRNSLTMRSEPSLFLRPTDTETDAANQKCRGIATTPLEEDLSLTPLTDST
jgi:hypothetical protein